MPFFKRRKQSRRAPARSVQKGEPPIPEADSDPRARLRAALTSEHAAGSRAELPTRSRVRRLVMWSGLSAALVAGLLVALYLAVDLGIEDEGGLAAIPPSTAPTATENSIATGSPTPSAEPTTSVPTPASTPVQASVFCEEGEDAFEYRVKPGDSMATIAADYGLFEGDVVLCDSSIANPSLIRPGQTILIPCPAVGCPEPQP